MPTYRLRERPPVEWALARAATTIHNLLYEIGRVSPELRQEMRECGADAVLAEVDAFRFKLMDERDGKKSS